MSQPSPTRVLYIDDDPDLAILMLRQLISLGYTAEWAESGERGLEMCQASPYDVILVDYQMPGMNGLEVLEALQKAWPPPAMILITAYGDNNLAVEAMRRGAVDYIVRDLHSMQRDLLRASIERALEHRSLLLQKQQAQNELAHFFELAPDLLMVFTLDGQIIRVNPAIKIILGYNPEDFYEHPLSHWLNPDDYEGLALAFAHLQANKGQEIYEGRFLHANGGYRWLACHMNAEVKMDRVYCNAHDVTNHRENYDVLHRSEAHYRGLLEQMQEGLLIRNADDLISYVNPYLVKMLGYTEAELINHSMQEFVVPEDVSNLRNHLDKRLQGETSSYEVSFQTKAGDIVHVLISGSPLYDEHNQFIGSFGVITDLTDRYRVERRTIELAIERERVEILSKFITNASHEFKTPLSIIQTSLYLLEKVRDLDKQGRYIANIKIQAEALLKLVEDLATMLELDSLETISMIPVDISGMLTQLLYGLQETCQVNGITLTYTIDPDVSQFVAHPGWVTRAIMEILDNAIRYNVAGGDIEVRNQSDDDFLIIEVEDHGIGITEADLPLVLERFYRHDQAHSTRGFGLGLSIAHRIMQLHGGKLEIISPIEPHGTLVRLYFPIKVQSVEESPQRLTSFLPH